MERGRLAREFLVELNWRGQAARFSKK